MTSLDSQSVTDSRDPKARKERTSEGLARAVYALIILTALIGQLGQHAESAGEALSVIAGSVVVLFLAHAFSDIVAGEFLRDRWLNWPEARDLLVVEAPLLVPAVAPVLLLLLAEAGVISLSVALEASLAVALGSLLLIGAFHGRSSGRGLAGSIFAGFVYAGLGGVIIFLEAVLE